MPGRPGPSEVVSVADAALYRAKAAGRGTVWVATISDAAPDGTGADGAPTGSQTKPATRWGS